jgi:hypothetical protein
MRIPTIGPTIGLFAALGLGIASPSLADIIWTNTSTVNGSGLGAVTTALTLQSAGSTTTESGCVGWDGSATFTGPGACSPAAPGFVYVGIEQAANTAWTVAEAGSPTNADQIRIVFNASEPGDPGTHPITLEHMFLTIWSDAGTLLFTSGDLNPRPQLFPETQQGTGVSGELFRLSASDVTAINVAGFLNDPTNHFGLMAALIDADGGIETFYLATVGPTVVPEPLTAVLIGTGLILLAAARYRNAR